MATIAVVGGANVDIQGFSSHRLRAQDSNPGRIGMSAGGVGRNIAENLVRLGHTVRFLTVLGEDRNGEFLLHNLRDTGIDSAHVEVCTGCSTSAYLCILDADASLHSAVADMAILERLNPSLLSRHAAAFEGIDLCVVDANLEERAIERTLELCGDTPCLIDPVSAAKAGRARRLVGRFYAAKPNEAELEVLSGMPVGNEDELRRAVEVLHDRGTHWVFVSLGSRGLYYSDGRRHGRVESRGAHPVNVSGAGDAMTAAIAGAVSDGKAIAETAAFAVCAAAITTEAESTVSPLLAAAAVEARVREVVLHNQI